MLIAPNNCGNKKRQAKGGRVTERKLGFNVKTERLIEDREENALEGDQSRIAEKQICRKPGARKELWGTINFEPRKPKRLRWAGGPGLVLQTNLRRTNQNGQNHLVGKKSEEEKGEEGEKMSEGEKKVNWKKSNW